MLSGETASSKKNGKTAFISEAKKTCLTQEETVEICMVYGMVPVRSKYTWSSVRRGLKTVEPTMMKKGKSTNCTGDLHSLSA